MKRIQSVRLNEEVPKILFYLKEFTLIIMFFTNLVIRYFTKTKLGNKHLMLTYVYNIGNQTSILIMIWILI